jgi:type I restriction enzyme S subunit
LDAGVSVNAGDRPATSAEVGVLKTSCVTNGAFDLSENKVVLEPDEQKRVTECVRGGTVIISRMNTVALVGANAYVESDAANVFLPDRLWAAKPAPDANMRFLAYILGSDRGRRAMSELAAGSSGSMKNIAKSAVLNLLIPVPEADEQEKITDCLTSLDKVIAAQTWKVSALKKYRRGLMQQLFPREGETLPRLRFPEFRDEPEWKEVKAGSLFANRTERGADALPLYSVTMTNGLVKRTSLDRRIDDIAEAAGNKKAHRHDVAYNMMRMWQGASGVAREDCMVSPAYVVLAPQMGVNSDFYGYLFKLPQMLRMFTAHSRGLTEDRLRLYYQDFSGIPLPQPDVREQRRIAESLSALDIRIAIEFDKLDALKTHKRGLMQQLFPSPKAV